MARLPTPGGDSGNWGTILNEYLSQSLKGDGTLKDDVVTTAAIADGSITNTLLADSTIAETKLASTVQTKLNQTAPTWTTLSGKPAVVAAGADTTTAKAALSLTQADVGLGNVDNTSDTNKPVSTAQQSALNLKAPLASPSFTGTVSGVSKSMVGLGNVDNTSDVNKPVSTATQTALDAKSTVIQVSKYIPTTATYRLAILAAITAAAAKPNGVVDFEGVNYVTEATINVTSSGVTLQNGGIVPTGQFTALQVLADDVTVRNMTFSRSQSYGIADTTIASRSCVVVNALRFSSFDCDYLSTAQACVYLSTGGCTGSVISGGVMTGIPVYQNACGVYAAGGVAGNFNITVKDVYLHDSTDGFLLFDTSDSRIEGCRVEHLRVLPSVTITGWVNVGGNVWRGRSASGTPGVDGVSTDRADGNSTQVQVNGVQLGTMTYNSSTPAANQPSFNNGYLYVNLNGTDPNTVTVTSTVTSGYAYMVYDVSPSNPTCRRNIIAHNSAYDVDGFGVYVQCSYNHDYEGGNEVIGNVLRNVCLVGSQNNNLSYAGLTVTGGTDQLVMGNTIDTVGASGKAVPGIWIYPDPAYNAYPSGRLVGNTVRNSFGDGYRIEASGWTVDGCHAHANVSNGFHIYSNTPSVILENITLSNCTASYNGVGGFNIDAGQLTTGRITARIIGGSAYNNTNVGVSIFGTVANNIADCAVIGMSLRNNGSSAIGQIRVRSGCLRTIISGNHMYSTVSGVVGLIVDALAVDTIISDNQYSIPIPEQILAVSRINGLTKMTLTSSATLSANGQYLVMIGASGAPTLPTAVGNNSKYAFKNIDTTSKNIATTSSQTIEGAAAPLALSAGSSVELVSDGANWRVI